MLNNQTLLELIEKYKGERTFFDGELVGAFFTVGHLEKLVEEVVKKYLITEQEPAQEPVAWVSPKTAYYFGITNKYETGVFRYGLFDDATIPLYTHPAPSWQGLSDDEKIEEVTKIVILRSFKEQNA